MVCVALRATASPFTGTLQPHVKYLAVREISRNAIAGHGAEQPNMCDIRRMTRVAGPGPDIEVGCAKSREDNMTRSIGLCGSGAFAALCSAMLLAGSSSAAAQERTTNHAALGGYLFKTYCATCHGTSARGDGPLADSMRRRPSNLTEIAKRNKGTYPKDLVFRIIDGRNMVRGHGGPDMPVWGDAFMRTSETTDEASVKHRIQALVDYLETVQARDTQ